LIGPSGFVTAKALGGFIQIRIRWWVASGPGHRSLQTCSSRAFVQPALIVKDDRGGAHDPNTRLELFHQNMAAGVKLAERALANAADELNGRRRERGSHGERFRQPPITAAFVRQ
jgi:hypothetical protein